MISQPIPPERGAAAARAARLALPRLARELKTVVAMLRIYCRDRHGAVPRDAIGLCAGCADLEGYARRRLASCPYGVGKPTCVDCPIHCYARGQREAMRTVMRYAGPRMLWRHPLLAMAHLVDGRRPAPPRPNGDKPAQRPGPPVRPPP